MTSPLGVVVWEPAPWSESEVAKVVRDGLSQAWYAGICFRVPTGDGHIFVKADGSVLSDIVSDNVADEDDYSTSCM